MPRPLAHRVPLDRYLDHRHARAAAWLTLAVFAFLLLSIADHKGWLFGPGGDLAKYDGKTFLVTHVVDGDTLDVDAPDHGRPTTRVHFLGTDAKVAQPFAAAAADLVRDKALNRRVELHLESQRIRDRFGRLLAYIELPNGTDLNEALLAAGFARADNHWTHSRLDRFTLIEAQAKRDQVGLWGRGPLKRAAPDDTTVSAATEPDDESDD